MSATYSGIVIGGEADGQYIGNAAKTILHIPTSSGGGYVEYFYDEMFGVSLWRPSDITTTDAARLVFERYGKFRDFASGKTQEVINALADRVQELLAVDAGKEAKILALEERNHALCDDYEIARAGFKRIREALKAVDIEDEGLSTPSLVDEAIKQLDVARAATARETFKRFREMLKKAGIADDNLSTLSLVEDACGRITVMRATLAQITAELRSTGHKHEGKPLDQLVDMAIDTERERHVASLHTIAAASGISFAIGRSSKDMVDTLCSIIRHGVLRAPQGGKLQARDFAATVVDSRSIEKFVSPWEKPIAEVKARLDALEMEFRGHIDMRRR